MGAEQSQGLEVRGVAEVVAMLLEPVADHRRQRTAERTKDADNRLRRAPSQTLRGTRNTHLRGQTALSRLAADSSLQREKQQEFEFTEVKGLVCNIWRF